MLQLLMSRSPRVSVRTTISRAIARTALRIADAASEFSASAPLPPLPVEQPEAGTDFYTPADMPTVEDIEAAAREYERVAEQARLADRGKRAAKKILDRLPAAPTAGGSWSGSRTTGRPRT